jgi:hypothetical protein
MALSSDEDLNEISKNQVFNLVFILSENYSTPCSVKAAVRYVSNHKIGLEYTHFDEDSGSMINDYLNKIDDFNFITQAIAS